MCLPKDTSTHMRNKTTFTSVIFGWKVIQQMYSSDSTRLILMAPDKRALASAKSEGELSLPKCSW